MAYDSKCLDLAQHFLGCEGDDGDETQSSLAQCIQDAAENWFAEQKTLRDTHLSATEQPAAVGEPGLSLDLPLLDRLEKASAIIANDDYTPPMTSSRARRVFVTETIIEAREALATPASAEAELRAEVAALRKDLADECERRDEIIASETHLRQAAEARAQALKASLDTALEALEPFAKAADVLSQDLADATLLFAHFPSLFGGQTEIRVGDLRRARQIREDSANG